MEKQGKISDHGWVVCNTTSNYSNGVIYTEHLTNRWCKDKVISVKIIECKKWE